MITIIGAGPAGLRTAELLASKGEEVAVLEEHHTIGSPVQCTGILTPSIKDILPLNKTVIINRLKQVTVHAPDRSTADINSGDLVIDRTMFDQHLANRAEKAGARIILDSRVESITHGKKIVLSVKDTKTKKSKRYSTDILIGADGPASIVSKSMGNPRPEFWIGKQARVKIPVGKYAKDTYQVYFGKKFPGFFGWIVPESDKVARVGVAATRNVDAVFMRLARSVGKHEVLEMQGGIIPKYNPKITVEKDRTYLVGDSATQVKATTGGGVVPGLRAAECLAKSIKNGSSYRAELAQVNRELKTHLMARNIMDRFSDTDYNRLVMILNRPGAKKAMIKHDRDHSIGLLIGLALREPSTLLFARALFRPRRI